MFTGPERLLEKVRGVKQPTNTSCNVLRHFFYARNKTGLSGAFYDCLLATMPIKNTATIATKIAQSSMLIGS
jgi:hypothetical protein